MESPLLKPVPTPRREVVTGIHRTARSSNHFQIVEIMGNGIRAHLGTGSDKVTYLQADGLRELATLFAELADALENK